MVNDKTRTNGSFRYKPNGRVEMQFLYTNINGERKLKSLTASTEEACMRRAD